MRELILTDGSKSAVDEVDFEWAQQYRWYWKNGYACRWVSGTKRSGVGYCEVYLHDEIMENVRTRHQWHVHHVNEDRLDNRRCNLEKLTPSQHHHKHWQSKNRQTAKLHEGPRGNRKVDCPYKGVCWHKVFNRWAVQLLVNGANLTLGTFDDPEEAALRYDAAVLCYRGGVGHLNLLPDSYKEQT